MKRRILLALGVVLVMFGSLVMARLPFPTARAAPVCPVMADLGVHPGGTLTKRFTVRHRDTYSLCLEVAPTGEQFEAMDPRPYRRTFLPEEPLRVRYRVLAGERVVSEGTREQAPVGGLEESPFVGTTLGVFHGDWGVEYAVEVEVLAPAPDYGEAKTTLLVLASRQWRRTFLTGKIVVWTLLGPIPFFAGTMLLLVLLLIGAFRWRRRPPLRRGRDAVNLDGWKRPLDRSPEPTVGGTGSEGLR